MDEIYEAIIAELGVLGIGLLPFDIHPPDHSAIYMSKNYIKLDAYVFHHRCLIAFTGSEMCVRTELCGDEQQRTFDFADPNFSVTQVAQFIRGDI